MDLALVEADVGVLRSGFLPYGVMRSGATSRYLAAAAEASATMTAVGTGGSSVFTAATPSASVGRCYR